MIELMKTVTLVTLHDDREKALTALRDLEIMHVQYDAEESSDLTQAMRDCEDLQNIIFSLKPFEGSEASSGDVDLPPTKLAAKASQLLSQFQRDQDVVQQLTAELEALAPWGEFDVEAIARLQERGIHVKLCAVNEKQMPEAPEGAVLQRINQIKDNIYFAVISKQRLHTELPEIKLPSASASKLQKRLQAAEKKIAGLTVELSQLAGQANNLATALVERNDTAEFLRTRDNMVAADRLTHISGYVPARREGDLKKAATDNGWALQIEDPDKEDRNVPTLLKIPAWLNVTKPIFDFIGISPGYREYDVSACFLFFFSIFFGMIIGDGGYGLIFLAVALFCKVKFRDPKAQSGINLFLILSSVTIAWGYLTGNWFAIPAVTAGGKQILPTFMQGVPWFTNGENVQLLCFIIAVTHLSIAHGWKAVALVALKKPLKALGELGWLSFVAGAFLIIADMVPKMKLLGAKTNTVALCLLGVGFVLMLLFSINWKDVGDILNFPFGALGGFVDSLSYIRLYAVGLSGFYVAQAVNDMATGMIKSGGVMAVAAIVIALGGHLVNMVLCAMGVLVHGIRLNTLEFSGHLGLEWAGTLFRPFRKQS